METISFSGRILIFLLLHLAALVLLASLRRLAPRLPLWTSRLVVVVVLAIFAFIWMVWGAQIVTG